MHGSRQSALWPEHGHSQVRIAWYRHGGVIAPNLLARSDGELLLTSYQQRDTTARVDTACTLALGNRQRANLQGRGAKQIGDAHADGLTSYGNAHALAQGLVTKMQFRVVGVIQIGGVKVNRCASPCSGISSVAPFPFSSGVPTTSEQRCCGKGSEQDTAYLRPCPRASDFWRHMAVLAHLASRAHDLAVEIRVA